MLADEKAPKYSSGKLAKIVSKVKKTFIIRKHDFKPEIKSGKIDRIENAVFYAVDGIGDIIVASPIIRTILQKCSGTVYFVCSPSSKLYVDILNKKYKNIIIVSVPKKEDLEKSDIDYAANQITKSGKVDVLVNGLGSISPLFARFASSLMPKAVLSSADQKKKIKQCKMNHMASYCSNVIYQQSVSIVDCWGVVAQIIGGQYSRTLLFPVTESRPVADRYIALSLAGVNKGIMTKENACDLCQAIFRHYHGKIYLLSSPGVEKLCKDISYKFDNVFIPDQAPSLETSGLYIKHADILVSVCSAPVHIAGAFNTPVMVISNISFPHWCPVVDCWDIYNTGGNSINEFDAQAFEAKFSGFMSRID